MGTAVSLWTVTLTGIAVYAMWASRWAAQGVPVVLLVAGGFAVYGAVFLVFMTAYFTLAWFARSKRPPYARIGPAATVRLVVEEYRALIASALRMMFYFALMKDPAAAPASRPVLLVHGVLCNAGMWAGFARRLAARGIRPVYSLSYGPTFASIDRFADQVARKIDAILAATGASQVVVVTHSMGGLVTLAYVRKYGAAKVRRLISMGAPYHGSFHACFAPGVCMGQMRPGNAWLAQLLRDASPRPPIHSIWSWHDSMVTPQTSSLLPGADNIDVIGIGHNALTSDPRSRDRAIALVDDALEAAGAAAATSEFPA